MSAAADFSQDLSDVVRQLPEGRWGKSEARYILAQG